MEQKRCLDQVWREGNARWRGNRRGVHDPAWDPYDRCYIVTIVNTAIKLPKEAGLAHTGLADDPHDLAAAGAGPLEGLAKRFQFSIAPHEAGSPRAAAACIRSGWA